MKGLLQVIKRTRLRATVRNWEDPNLILAAQTLMSSESWRQAPDYSNPFWLQDKEFRVYSQFGDDGIIQWLLRDLGLRRGAFVEFGVGDYYESNTHFLLINNRYQGFVMDGSLSNIETIRSSSMYWRYNLNALQRFVDKENVNSLLSESGFSKIDLLHIDLDGNDYWVLEALDLSELDPDILILEYNATFGKECSISVPYDPTFSRINAHYSAKYFGASLLALNHLAEVKGYYFIGCNSAGNNAYFLSDRHVSRIPKTNVLDGYQGVGYREARDEEGRLTYFLADQELALIKGLPVFDVISRQEKIL